jgi:hypothetical protein
VKLEKALWETGGRINTVLVAQSVLSLIMIAVALGLTSYPSELSVLGFRLGVSLPAFLCGGAVTAACLLMYQIGLVHHEEELLKSVLDIYDLDWTPRLRQSVKLHFAVRCRSIVGRG